MHSAWWTGLSMVSQDLLTSSVTSCCCAVCHAPVTLLVAVVCMEPLKSWLHSLYFLKMCAAGVHEAIQLKYLKALHFGFSSDACGENLLEEYVYHFAYDGNKVQLTANGTDISLSQSTQVKPA